MSLDPNFQYKFTLKSTAEAITWFKAKVKELKTDTGKPQQIKRISQRSILEVLETQHTFDIGKMYLYHYDPKTRKELPYYDTFPLILLTNIYKNGFSGLNLHYLPVESRMILISNLMQKIVFKDGELDRLNIKYDNLKGVQEFQFYEPCFKRYLLSNIRTQIKLIEPSDWGFAAALPIEAFKKKTKQEVWKISMESLDMTL